MRFIFWVIALLVPLLAQAASPMIYGPNNTSLNLQKNIQFLFGGPGIYQGTTDPTSVAVSASKGSIYLDTSNGFIYIKQDSGLTTNWTLDGFGTVTSVSQTVPVEFSIAGSPITSSGTLAITKATQSANTVWAGPTSGGVLAPTFRSLVSADIPSLSTIYCALTGCTMAGNIAMGSNFITGLSDPTTAQGAATKNYVDTQLAQLNPAAAVYAASLANVSGTYLNAVSGVCIGDTFTTTATTAFALDGVSPPVNSRVLLKNQTFSFQDGVWVLTAQAVGGVSGAVLTRALDFDSSSDINAGQIIPVVNGTQAGSSWYQTAVVTTCNTDSQTYTKFQNAASAYLLSANNLSDVANVTTSFDTISPLVAKGDIVIYSGTHNVAQSACSNGQQLQYDSTQTNGVKCVTPSAGSSKSTIKFASSGGISVQDDFDGQHDSAAAETLSVVGVSMSDTGISGATYVSINHANSAGVLLETRTITINATGTRYSTNISLSSAISLSTGDSSWPDITGVANGVPQDLSVEFQLQ